MKKILVFVLLLFISLESFSQLNVTKSYKKIDSYARSVKTYKNIKDLQTKLTRPFRSDEEKIRSIFIWITDNISYDTEEYHKDTCGMYDFFFERLTLDGNYTDKQYNFEIVKYVLSNKKAICDGYSRLLKILCDSSGLKCERISGAVKNNVKDIGVVSKSSHAWNAVQIDGKWKLLDATWASGPCDDSVKHFTKKYDEAYFFPDPHKLCYNHFPDEKKWFLLPNPPSKTQFDNYPLVYEGFFNDEITGFTPINGLINIKTGDKLQFSITFKAKGKPVSVQDWEPDGRSYERTNLKKSETRVNFEYIVPNDSIQHLGIMYNGDVIMNYRTVH